ncbi:MAG: hypothetical protein LC777_17200, partial [Actinobacteria bacterium]|nr:hypothetical protein [Actinomycetota bacterium]
LPGYAPRGTPDRANQAALTLSELDAAIGAFIRDSYHQRAHGETGEAPQARWDARGFLPRLPDSLQQLIAEQSVVERSFSALVGEGLFLSLKRERDGRTASQRGAGVVAGGRD